MCRPVLILRPDARRTVASPIATMVAVIEFRRRRARTALIAGALAAVMGLATPTYAAPGDSEQSEASNQSPQTESTSSAPEPACDNPPSAAQINPKVPWTVANYDPAQRLWPYSSGKGVTVAVVSTGVAPTQSQLAPQMLTGYDFVRNTSEGMDDCIGQGTAIATVIAAQESDQTGFVGLAPDAKILPVRVAEKEQVVANTDEPLDPATIASGIEWAAEQGAGVIVVADVSFVDDPALASAVKAAQSAGAVIVAPVGDDHPKEEPASLQPTPADRTPYPAAYEGVIGVGAMSSSGIRVPSSQVGPYVDVIAPGEDVPAGAPSGGHQVYSGTAIASSFAAAAVTLLLAQPDTPWVPSGGIEKSLAVELRLRSTASPVSGHFAELGYGAGAVDPARALTDLTNSEAAASATPYEPPVRSEQELAQQKFAEDGESRALALTWGALGGLAAVVLALSLLRRVRANKARVLSTPERVESERDQELQYVPGEQLFAPPAKPE